MCDNGINIDMCGHVRVRLFIHSCHSFTGWFWVSEQRLVDQANTIHRNSWMTEFEIEELGRNLAGHDRYKEEERSVDDTGNDLEEEVRGFLTALEADEEIGNLEEE